MYRRAQAIWSCRIPETITPLIPNGEPSVFLLWSPPGARPFAGPHRHYHKSVAEYHFILEGETPTWVYDSAEQQRGDFFNLREGFYLERQPGPNGLHGREGEQTSPTGCMMLVWRDVTGNFIHEPDAAEETIEVPY